MESGRYDVTNGTAEGLVPQMASVNCHFNHNISYAMIGGLIAGILVIIILLALIGLGWETVVSGVKKGADKVGITPIVQGFANGAREIVVNATRTVIGS